MNVQPEPIVDAETPPTTGEQPTTSTESHTDPTTVEPEAAQPDQEIMEETPADPAKNATAPADQDQSFFFPNLLGDGRSISVTAPDRDTAESRAKEQLAQEIAQSS